MLFLALRHVSLPSAAVGQWAVAEPFGLNPSDDAVAVNHDLDPVTLDIQGHDFQLVVEREYDLGILVRVGAQGKALTAIVAGA